MQRLCYSYTIKEDGSAPEEDTELDAELCGSRLCKTINYIWLRAARRARRTGEAVLLKIHWNRKYTTIAVYAFLVIAASILFAVFVGNFGMFLSGVSFFLSLISPFLYGFAIAFLVNPVMKFCERVFFSKIRGDKYAGLRRALALLVSFLFVAALLFAFLSFVIPQLAQSITSLVNNIPSYIQATQSWITEVVEKLSLPESFMGSITDSVEGVMTQSAEILGKVAPMLLDATINITTFVKNGVIGLIISAYMLLSKEKFFAQLKKVLYALLPKHYVEHLVSVTHKTNTTFSGFISGKLIDSLIIGVLTFLVLSVFQMPYTLLVSVIVGITNVIPFFGPFIGAVPSAIIILIENPFKCLLFVIIIVVIQQIDGNIIGPKILGDSTGITAFWVIFAILVGGGLFGFLGMFIGVPAFAVIYSLIRTQVERSLEKKGLPTDTASYASEEHPLPKQ